MALAVGARCFVLNFVFVSVLLCFVLLFCFSCLNFIHYPILLSHVCLGTVRIQDFLLEPSLALVLRV